MFRAGNENNSEVKNIQNFCYEKKDKRLCGELGCI
jgi:hypothetical protein